MSDAKSAKCQNPAIIVMKRELKAYFTSPVAYFVTVLFLLVSGIFFYFGFMPLYGGFFLMDRAELRAFFSALPHILSCIIPAVTMRLFAEEKRSGSIETLMTLPVTETDIVTGKYLASFIGSLIMLAPTLLFIIPAEVYGSPDYGPIVGGFIGAIFLCASFTAIGIFTSAITKNQIVAFLAGIAICVVITMIDFLLIFLPSGLSAVLGFLSAKSHFTSISRGIIDTRDFIYFISLTALFFTATVKVQQNAKA
jgi:ABC-2 type transport system permease protein